MRNKVARHFRQMAKAEMSQDRAPDRDLVEHPNRSSVINAPKSVRSMYQRLKKAYKNIRSFVTPPQHIVVRNNKKSGFYRPQNSAPPVLIQSPLKQLRKGAWWVCLEARQAANRGDGAAVQRLARSYL